MSKLKEKKMTVIRMMPGGELGIVVTKDSYLVFISEVGQIGLSIEQSESLLSRLPGLIAEQKQLLLERTNTDLSDNLATFQHPAPNTVS